MYLISTKSLFLLFLNVVVFISNIMLILLASYTIWAFFALGLSSFAIWLEFHYHIERIEPQTITEN